jgi:glycosyltransferase involved in cell wall biosynthesis
VIPLRVLHALPDQRGAEWEAWQSLLGPLLADGHDHAVLLPEGMQPAGVTAFPLIALPIRWLPWWSRAEPAALAAIAAWMPDLLHIHHPTCLARSLPLARRLDLPVTCVVHSPSPAALLRRLRDPRIACTTVLGEHHRAGLIAGLGLSRDRVTVLPCGVQTPDTVQDTAQTGPLTVGAIGPERSQSGLDRLARAVARVGSTERPVRLRLLPDPADPEADREALSQLARRHDAAIEVSVATHATSLRDFIAGIDALVTLAPDPHPWPMLQALAWGRPVLATATGTASELLPADQQLAVLISPANEAALDAGLAKLTEPSHRLLVATHGPQVVSEHSNAALVARAQAELWRSALTGGQHHGASELSSVWKRVSASRLRRPER